MKTCGPKHLRFVDGHKIRFSGQHLRPFHRKKINWKSLKRLIRHRYKLIKSNICNTLKYYNLNLNVKPKIDENKNEFSFYRIYHRIVMSKWPKCQL